MSENLCTDIMNTNNSVCNNDLFMQMKMFQKDENIFLK